MEKIGKVKQLILSAFGQELRPFTHDISDSGKENEYETIQNYEGSSTSVSFLSSDTVARVQSEKEHSPKRKNSSENSFSSFAYAHFASRIPLLAGYRQQYQRSGIPQIYEAYMARALLTSLSLSVSCFATTLVLSLILKSNIGTSLIVASLLGFGGFVCCIFAWLTYPIHKRKVMKQSLEDRLAYSIGILGVLSSTGMGVEELFEHVSELQTNPVLAELSKRFLRNIKVFGMDTASALSEVSAHCPSLQFSRFLESIEVAFQTRGSLRDLITFESTRLFSEKRDKLRKSGNDLSVMAELYVSLVVVMPIFFIVMFVIFQLLPKVATLPPATLMTNVLLFVGVPIVSVGFIIVLDSMIPRT